MKNKKTKVAIIGIIALVLVTIGITYAYWLITRTQTGENVITTGCLDISLNGSGDITLSNQFPLADEDGMKLTPYTFTVTNNCNTSVDYQVALEATGDESTAIVSEALKVSLNDTTKLYSAYSEVATTVSGAYESRAIGYSRLAAKGSEGATDSYSLRIWIDEDADISEMNKTFKSKITVTIGQGFESSFAEGTLAYSILANYGGVNAVSEIDTTEEDHRITANGNVYISTSSNYYYGTEYTYDEETGKYTLGGTIVQATTSECRTGTKTCGKYTLQKTSSTSSSATLYEVTDFQSSGNYVTADTIEYVTAFSALSTEASLNKTKDDLGDSYYFRGESTDNYVKFGSYADNVTLNLVDYNDYYMPKTIDIAAGDPMYWRIVRVNGDGTIRLVYDGIERVANGTNHTAIIGTTAYNTNYDDVKYVGYTYDVDGTQVDSTIKGVIEAWYENNLEATYGEFIADGIFCNDRSVVRTSGNNTYYAPYVRLNENKTPVLTCENKEDRYTKEDTINGNGLLSKPVGLITADEIFFAGGTSRFNANHYLYSGEVYWTSTPGMSSKAFVYTSHGNDMVNADDLEYIYNGMYGARPVINLKADVEFTGNGTIDSPYEIVME